LKPTASKKRFLQVLGAKSHKLASLSPVDGIAVMLDWYREERADGCDLRQGGDMLLYQWGCYDWGEGEFFELNITRQFIDGAGEDEDIRQLLLTFKYKPTAPLRRVKDGNRWCKSPNDLKKFRSFIDSSEALRAVAETDPAQVTLNLDIAG
jgi:hypothetical protein